MMESISYLLPLMETIVAVVIFVTSFLATPITETVSFNLQFKNPPCDPAIYSDCQ